MRRLEHPNIVPLLGVTQGFGPNTRGSVTLDVEWYTTLFLGEQVAHSGRATATDKPYNAIFKLAALTIRRCTALDPVSNTVRSRR